MIYTWFVHGWYKVGISVRDLQLSLQKLSRQLTSWAESKGSQCGQYNCFSPKNWQILNTSQTDRNCEAIHKKQVNESTVRSIEKAYREAVSRKWKIKGDTIVSELLTKGRGRLLLLDDKKVQVYIGWMMKLSGISCCQRHCNGLC